MLRAARRPKRSKIRRMALRDVAAAVTRDADKPVRQQLERLLASATFKQVDRLKRFLSFIVLESIGGRSTELKEYVIGVEVFRRGESFDPRTDNIVRVKAGKLRTRLETYYETEGRGDPILIEYPKGRYVPVFRAPETREPQAPAPEAPASDGLLNEALDIFGGEVIRSEPMQ